jgi:hypothetical protein
MRKPVIKGSIIHAFEGKKQAHTYYITGPKKSLGIFRETLHLIICSAFKPPL